jgi:multicomponent Na+:H+ antiporter subunit D
VSDLSFLLLVPVIAAAVAGLVTLIYGHKVSLRNFINTLASIISFLAVVFIIPSILVGRNYTFSVLDLVAGLKLAFYADGLGVLFASISSLMWVLLNLYSIGYMSHHKDQQRFFTYLSLSMSAAFGVALAENLFTLYLFWELLSIFPYPLVRHIGTKEAEKAANRYLIYMFIESAFLLAAIIITYFITGTLSLTEAGLFGGVTARSLLIGLFFLYLVGFGIKAAIMPMHHWLPSAMIAPTPVSTLLHAVAVVKAGVFGILRLILNVYGIELVGSLGLSPLLAGLAAFTIIVGSLVALQQDNLKRRLAYSTISQLSYIFLGAALLSPAAVLAAMVHIANHAFAKGTLFMCAGIIEEETGKKRVSEMVGVGNVLPITMTTFTVASLSMVGLPPLAGFITKWYLGIGAVEAGMPIFIGVLLLSALLNALYFLPIPYEAFLGRTWERRPEIVFNGGQRSNLGRETTIYMMASVVLTCLGTVVLGLGATIPGLPLSLAEVFKKIVLRI